MSIPDVSLDWNTTGAVVGNETQKGLDYMIALDGIKATTVSHETLKRAWGWVEQSAPVGDVHTYDWSDWDDDIGFFSDRGFDIEIQVLCQSSWATYKNFTAYDQRESSPPKSGTIPGNTITYMQAWANFITALVTRYPEIKVLTIGAEVDSYSAWPANCPTPSNAHNDYIALCTAAYTAAKAVNPNIVIARGNSNLASLFNDMPSIATADSRIASFGNQWQHVVDSMTLDPTGAFDVFAINANDHYTGLFSYVGWLRQKMQDNSWSTPIHIGDANASLHIREDVPSGISPSPHYYPDDLVSGTRDPYTALDDPVTYPDEAAYWRPIYYADQASYALKKLIVAMYLDAERFFFQPSWDGLAWGGDFWHHAGLIDAEKYDDGDEDINECLKPVYWALRRFLALIEGADSSISKLDLGTNVWAFKFTRDGESIIVAWAEDVMLTDASGLVDRDQWASADLGSHFAGDTVRVRQIVEAVTVDGVPVEGNEYNLSPRGLPLSMTPIFVTEPEVDAALKRVNVAWGEPPYDDTPFGDLLSWLDVRGTKMSFRWDTLEPTAGEYDWSSLDAFLDEIDEDAVNLVNIFTTGSVHTVDTHDKGCPIISGHEQAYTDFICALVRRCAGKVKYFERDTEPFTGGEHWPSSELNAFKATATLFYDAVKQVEPDADVVGIGHPGGLNDLGNLMNMSDYQQIIAHGKYDVVDLRLYNSLWTIGDRIDQMRTAIDTYGIAGTPIVCCEMGGPDPRAAPEWPDYEDEVMDWINGIGPEPNWATFPDNLKMFLQPPYCTDALEARRQMMQFNDIFLRHLFARQKGCLFTMWWNLQSGGAHPIFGKMRLCEASPAYTETDCYYTFRRFMDDLRKTTAIAYGKSGDVHQFQMTVPFKDAVTIVTFNETKEWLDPAEHVLIVYDDENRRYQDIKHRDIAVGEAAELENNLFDVYHPCHQVKRPVVLFCHGGEEGGTNKDESYHIRLANQLAAREIICIVTNYRSGELTIDPTEYAQAIAYALVDHRTMMGKMIRHGPMRGADPDRIFVAGGSAGAALSMMSIYGDLTDPFPITPYSQKSRIAGVIDLWGFVPWINGSNEVEALTSDQGVNWFTGETTPLLTIHGTADIAVDYACATEIARQCGVSGTPHVLITLDGAEHGAAQSGHGAWGTHMNVVCDAIKDWIDSLS